MSVARPLPAKTALEVRRPSSVALGLKRLLGPDWRLGFLFVLPIVVLVLALVACPALARFNLRRSAAVLR